MRCQGLLQTIQIRRQGYGYIGDFQDFLQRYFIFLPQSEQNVTEIQRNPRLLIEKCRKCISLAQIPHDYKTLFLVKLKCVFFSAKKNAYNFN